MRIVTLTVATVLALATPSQADFSLFDDTFNNMDWDLSAYVATGGAYNVTDQHSPGGNPGFFRFMIHHLPPFSSLGVIHYNIAHPCDPSFGGGIFFVEYSESRVLLPPPPFDGAAVGAYPALVQDDVAYFGPNVDFTNTAWGTVSLTLTASDFLSATGSHPDFGSTGGLIYFGYARSNSNTGPLVYEIWHGMDNFSVHAAPVGVAESGVHAGAATLRSTGPNPFSSTVSYEVSFPIPGDGTVSVYDLRGVRQRTLRDGAWHAGKFEGRWDGTDDRGRRVPPGVYIVELRSRGIVTADKVVAIR